MRVPLMENKHQEQKQRIIASTPKPLPRHPNIHRGRGIQKVKWGEIDRTNNEIQYVL